MPQIAAAIKHADDEQDGKMTDLDVAGKLMLVMLHYHCS